jgi:hypothetical protein
LERQNNKPIRLVFGMAQELVKYEQVQIQLPNKRGLERYGFEFYDHIATELQMIKEQVDVKVQVTHFEQNLTTDKGEAGSKFQQEAPDVTDKRLLDSYSRCGSAVPRKSKRYGS